MNQTQRIMYKLKETHNIMVKSTFNLLERGEHLKTAEKRSDDVMKTSELFMFKTIPWYSRVYIKSKKLLFCPSWWFTSCCYQNTEAYIESIPLSY